MYSNAAVENGVRGFQFRELGFSAVQFLCFEPLCDSITVQLSMGPFCVTRSNPTYQVTDPTQPNPLQVEKFGPNPTQLNTNRAYSLV